MSEADRKMRFKQKAATTMRYWRKAQEENDRALRNEIIDICSVGLIYTVADLLPFLQPTPAGGFPDKE